MVTCFQYTAPVFGKEDRVYLLKLCRCPSFLEGRKYVCFLSSVLVSVNAKRRRNDMVAVTRNFCLITSNTIYPELSRPQRSGKKMRKEIKGKKGWTGEFFFSLCSVLFLCLTGYKEAM